MKTSTTNKLKAWIRQLTDPTVTDWVSYGSMSHQRQGRAESIELHKQGIVITLSTGTTVVWRCSQAFARLVLGCLQRSPVMVHVHADSMVATAGMDLESLFASDEDVAEYYAGMKQRDVVRNRRLVRQRNRFTLVGATE